MTSVQIAYFISKALYATGVVAASTVGFLRFRDLERVTRWCLAWLVFSLIATKSAEVFARVAGNTTGVSKTWTIFSAPLALCIVAAALRDVRWRRGIYAVAALVFVAMVLATFVVEERAEFSKVTGAAHGLILTVAGATMVMTRAYTARGRLFQDPGFLIGAGLLLTGVPSSFNDIYTRMVGVGSRPRDAIEFLMAFKNFMALVMYAFMIRAFLLLPVKSRRPAGGIPE